MKSYKLFAALLFLTAVFTTSFVRAQKQPSAKSIAIKNAVDSQRYIFTAEYANPMRGGQRYLTSQYTITILKDSIICDLPYFGQATTAPMPGTDGGIHFTTTNFTYTIAPAKKGGWDVNIKLKDANETTQLALSIFSNGSTIANVTSLHRDPIAFNGYVKGINN